MEYKLIYTARRTVGAYIKNGELTVRAPHGLSVKIIERFLEEHKTWIEKNLARSVQKKEKESALSEPEIKSLKKEARKYLTEKTEYYSKIMGLKYGRITITSAEKRFGSCSSEGNISFSFRLMLYPEAAREYVVVHELAHLREMNHSSRFYAIVAGVLPDYKSRKRLLK